MVAVVKNKINFLLKFFCIFGPDSDWSTFKTWKQVKDISQTSWRWASFYIWMRHRYLGLDSPIAIIVNNSRHQILSEQKTQHNNMTNLKILFRVRHVFSVCMTLCLLPSYDWIHSKLLMTADILDIFCLKTLLNYYDWRHSWISMAQDILDIS